MANSQLTFRQASAEDLTSIQQLFVETINAVCLNDYSPDQIEAWTSGIKNTQRWLDKLVSQYFILAEIKQQLVGFASLENNDYLDVLYIHKDFQRHGIADFLYGEIENEAKRRNREVLIANVSFTARGFFDKKGYRELAFQTHIINHTEISNYKMMKTI